MNPNISIGASKHIDLLKLNLNKYANYLKDNGYKLEINELPVGKYTFLRCNLDDSRNKNGSCQIFKNYVADVVSDIILNKWENYIIYDIIRQNYFYYNEDEKNKIFRYAQKHVSSKGMSSDDGKTVYQNRRSQIYRQLQEHLSSYDELIIDGFIQFRLKDYVSFLSEVIESAVDEFLMEKEYDDFIQILRYFAEIQEPRVNEAHVLVKTDGSFKLYDENKNIINSDYLEDFILTINEEINYEDLVISALISISPKKIIFHHTKNNAPENTIKTVKDVFVGRVSVCGGCEWCSSIKE